MLDRALKDVKRIAFNLAHTFCLLKPLHLLFLLLKASILKWAILIRKGLLRNKRWGENSAFSRLHSSPSIYPVRVCFMQIFKPFLPKLIRLYFQEETTICSHNFSIRHAESFICSPQITMSQCFSYHGYCPGRCNWVLTGQSFPFLK